MNQSIRFRVDHPGHVLALYGLRTIARWLSGHLFELAFEGDRCRLVHEDVPADLSKLIVRTARAPVEEIANDASEKKDRAEKATNDTSEKPKKDRAAPILLRLQPDIDPRRLDWWTMKSRRSWKMWSGMQTATGKVTDMQEKILKMTPEELANPLDYTTPMSGRFGFDPSSGRTMLSIGFSPNRVGLLTNTAPVVELFALIGLQEWQPTPVGEKVWEFEVAGERRRFGLNQRGQYKALTWAEEVGE